MSTGSLCSQVSREAYWVSKTRAEQAAWRLALDSGLDLVAICPAFVLGPLLARHVASSTSVQFMKASDSAGNAIFPLLLLCAHLHVAELLC